MFYRVYLDGFTNEDGSVNWLPGAASVEGILANTALFEEYGIELPHDYVTFVEACDKFSEYGIRGFATDYKYDYTDYICYRRGRFLCYKVQKGVPGVMKQWMEI